MPNYIYFDSIDVVLNYINRCYICNSDILPEDEIVQFENEEGIIYKIAHYLCESPESYPGEYSNFMERNK